MADGSSKRIADVRVGDKVLATDPMTGKTTAEKVMELHKNTDTELVDVTVKTAHGSTAVVHTTAEHPFWSPERHRWVNAADLRPHEALHVPVPRARLSVVASKSSIGQQTMYNLTVADLHTYYVMAGITPVLVHNAPPAACRITSSADSPAMTSKTVTPRSISSYGIDVENPIPGGEGAAQIHVQFMGRGADPRKYYLNVQTREWIAEDGTALSPRVAGQIDQKYVDKALQYLGVSGG